MYVPRNIFFIRLKKLIYACIFFQEENFLFQKYVL